MGEGGLAWRLGVSAGIVWCSAVLGQVGPSDQRKEQLQQALLQGDSQYFATIFKPDLNMLNEGSCFSFIHEVCLANHDKLPQCFQSLLGGLENKQAVAVICRELLYLDAEAVFRSPGGKERMAAFRGTLCRLIEQGGSRADPRTLAELQSRYSIAPEERSPATTRPGDAACAALLENRRLLQVSCLGAARATAYTMTSLFFRQRDRLHFAWQDAPVTNCLGVLHPDLSRPSIACVLGEPTDDHGNAALVRDTKGRVHAIVGAHHGPFLHRIADDAQRPYAWRSIAEVGRKATHPCLVCDREGVLHLAYRSSCENPWLLCYQRYGPDEAWSTETPLVRAAKTWYVTWTNSMAVGPDGALHLVFAVTRFIDEAPYFGAAHVYSQDGGRSWQQYGGRSLLLPIDAGTVVTIEDPSERAERILPAHQWDSLSQARDKLTVTLQMLLSNLVVDAASRPWVVVHNTLAKTADLYCADKGRWQKKAALAPVLQQLLPGYAISEQSALSRHRSGHLEAVLMVVPLKGREPLSVVGWQSNDLRLVRVLFDPEGKPLGARLVAPATWQNAVWLPNLEKWDWNHPFDHPALLFSSGRSLEPDEARSQGKKAEKEVRMEVWLDMAKD